MLLSALRWLHVVGAAVLLGTGAGIAFFMLVSHRSRKPSLVAHTASIVVLADFVFTASAVLLQPVTGFLLARIVGWPLTQGWIALSLVLYVVAGLCWLPVIWIQIRMRDLARMADMRGHELPVEYQRLFSRWVMLGVPAFLSILAIVWLMVAKPALA
jgi:uncharacterized membrane protein